MSTEQENKAKLDEIRALRDQVYERDGMAVRTRVLHTALHIEGMVNLMLNQLLGVKEGKSIPIHSFDTKVEILVLIGGLQTEDSDLFKTFGRIRNKFVHSIQANTLEKCCELAGHNTTEKILKLGQQEADKLKAQGVEGSHDLLGLGVKLLSEIVFNKAKDIEKIVYARNEVKVQHTILMNWIEEFGKEFFAIVNPAIQRVIDEPKETYTKEEVFERLVKAIEGIRRAANITSDDVVLKYINDVRQKRGEPPLTAVPTEEELLKQRS